MLDVDALDAPLGSVFLRPSKCLLEPDRLGVNHLVTDHPGGFVLPEIDYGTIGLVAHVPRVDDETWHGRGEHLQFADLHRGPR